MMQFCFKKYYYYYYYFNDRPSQKDLNYPSTWISFRWFFVFFFYLFLLFYFAFLVLILIWSWKLLSRVFALKYHLSCKLIMRIYHFSTRVFLLGPSHHYYTPKCALSRATVYKTPIGDLPIDLEGNIIPDLTYICLCVANVRKLLSLLSIYFFSSFFFLSFQVSS